MSVEDSSPAVVAYRIGQLEITVKEGFISHNEKLDKLVENFATKGDVLEIGRHVHELNSAVTTLTATDNRQQGAIDANRRYVSVGLAILGIVVAAVTTYLGLKHS